MLNIVEKNNEELTVLQHGANVFHEALELVQEGEIRFHVTDKNGNVPDYDLEYTKNMMLFSEVEGQKSMKMLIGVGIIADLMCYTYDYIDMM